MEALERRWLDELEAAASTARDQLGVSTLSISRLAGEAATLSTLVNVGTLGPGEERRPQRERYPLRDFPAARALVSHHLPYLFNLQEEGDQASLTLAAELEKTSQAAVPLVIDDDVWGELWVASTKSDLPLADSELDLIIWAAMRFTRTLRQLLDGSAPTFPSLHLYQLWIEGTLDPESRRELPQLSARRFGSFTALTAVLDTTDLYDTLDMLAQHRHTVVGVGRAGESVPLPPARGSGRRAYILHFAGDVHARDLDLDGVAVRRATSGTLVSGRLDHQELTVLLQRAHLVGAELVRLSCRA